MPPKSKKKKIEAESSPVDEIENNSDEEWRDIDTDECASGDSEEEEEEEEEEDDDDDFHSESGEADEEVNSENENEEGGEEEGDKEKEVIAVPKMKMADMLENKKGKIVSMNYCAKHLYKGPIENIKDMLNGSAVNEIEIKEEKPDKNEPAFKNVCQKWGWKQEVMLIEGIEANGLFNWELIAAQLSKQSGRNFKAEEVKNHYYQYYFNGTLGQVWNYQLEEKPLKHFDHTDPVVVSSTNKYLPPVAPKNLREIKFLPHREDFEEFPPNDIELMVTRVDFSSYYMKNLKVFKIDKEVKNLQLAIVDAYRRVVADRIKMYKFMKDFKLIEQFFNMDCKITKKCEVEKYFNRLQKFVGFFDSPDEFIKFFFDCVKEKLLKLEIARIRQILATRKQKERDPEMKVMLKKRAPGCFSTLTRILYYKNLKSGRKSLSLQEEKERDDVLIYALPTILEGMRLNCE